MQHRRRGVWFLCITTTWSRYLLLLDFYSLPAFNSCYKFVISRTKVCWTSKGSLCFRPNVRLRQRKTEKKPFDTGLFAYWRYIPLPTLKGHSMLQWLTSVHSPVIITTMIKKLKGQDTVNKNQEVMSIQQNTIMMWISVYVSNKTTAYVFETKCMDWEYNP